MQVRLQKPSIKDIDADGAVKFPANIHFLLPATNFILLIFQIRPVVQSLLSFENGFQHLPIQDTYILFVE